MLDPATARLCVWRLPLEAAFRLFSKLGSLGGSIRSGFRERDGQGQHWRGPHSHGGFLKMIVCESGGHANGLTYYFPFSETSPTTRPPGGLSKPWALPTPAFATWQGVQATPTATPAPQPQSVGSPPTSKGQAATRFFASLDRFPAPSASDRFLLPKEMERGQGRRSRAFHP